MKTVAFLTYNTVGRCLGNGWHEGDGRRAFVLQNSTGSEWFANQRVRSAEEAQAQCGRVSSEIGRLWTELHKAMPELDHVVVYVGASGSEKAIELAAQLSASKVTFVGCSCGIFAKKMLACSAGLGSARWVDCECGGQYTMALLYARFMDTGSF
jgi:hypothetical protein